MRLGRTGMIVSTTLLAIIWMASLHAQPPATSSVHREGFEQGTICWRTGVADAPFQETLHRLDSKIAHTGTRSESVQLIAKPGTHIYYWYSLPKAEIVEDLKVSVWVKANRPGMRVGARVVLPQERNAKNLDQPVTLLLTGDVYAQTGEWQQLWLRDPKKELAGQSLLLQGEVNRKVNTDGAFIDQLQLNIYSGPGEYQVWMDDIEINPVISNSPGEARSTTPANTASIRNATPPVELTRNKLVVEKQNYFLRGIRFTDAASLKSLREIGFNTLWVDSKTPEATLTSAVKEGFWLVPELRPPQGGMAMLTSNSLRTEMDRFPRTDHVLAWQLSGETGLTSEQVDVVSKSLRGSRTQGQLY